MLQCEGYKMFYGIATVTPPNPRQRPFTVKGTWLFRPDTGRWYVGDHYFDVSVVSDFHEINPSTPPNAMDELFSDSMEALDRLIETTKPRARE